MIALLDVTHRQAALGDVIAWAFFGVAIGYGAHRSPLSWFAGDRWLTRIRPFEREGRFYQRSLRIGRWKDRLPEAGGLFSGGYSKRSLVGSDQARLERFAAETRRAEATHWALLAVVPTFALWNPWWLTAVMLAYALAANVPFLLVQRYNRARIERVLARRRSRGTVAEKIGH